MVRMTVFCVIFGVFDLLLLMQLPSFITVRRSWREFESFGRLSKHLSMNVNVCAGSMWI